MASPQTKDEWLLVLKAIDKIQTSVREGDWDALRGFAGVLHVGAVHQSGGLVGKPLSKAGYLFSGSSGSHYRVVLGFETQEEASAAHTLLAHMRVAAKQAEADEKSLALETSAEWECMPMDAKPGTKVVFTGKGGYPGEVPMYLAFGANVGDTYTVERTEIGQSHTSVYLVEIPGKRFNHVCFEVNR